MKAEGQLQLVESNVTQNKVAVYLDPIFKDKNGVLWQGRMALFKHDLKRVKE